jgi:outer membrane protein
MPRPSCLSWLPLVLLGLRPAVASAQDSMSLDDALRLARQRNGTIQSAFHLVDAAHARVLESYAAFFPVITPQYQYNNVRQDGPVPLLLANGSLGQIAASWTLLDSGDRNFVYRSSQSSLRSVKSNSQQTVRATLFTVTQQYYDALRAQELDRVSGSEVDRTKTILDQTLLRIQVRDAAPIERLQANADYQNARVQALTTHNQVTNAAATLKATIGMDTTGPLPTLRNTDEPLSAVPDNLNKVIADGLKARPDLESQRLAIEAEDFNRRKLQLDAGPTFSLGVTDDYQFYPVTTNNRAVELLASVPLSDGGLSRAQVREIRANIASDRALLKQSERNARAEIEAAYATCKTDAERLAAAQVALDAAQENYKSTVDSRDKGASDLLQVLTAQVSLVTAESNFIQAQYDARIADVQLRLVTGRPIPGESL